MGKNLQQAVHDAGNHTNTDDARISFGDEAEVVQENVRGIKLDQSKSKFAQKEKVERFEERANEVHDALEDRRARAIRIAKQFWECMNSKTLSENKGPIQKNTEKELIGNLQMLATEMNGDEHEPEGAGSVALFTLLVKTCILLRDRLNSAEYKLEQLEKKAQPQKGS